MNLLTRYLAALVPSVIILSYGHSQASQDRESYTAGTSVAFLELKDSRGRVIQLEPNGQFAHVAISFRGQWLHAYPNRGVEIIQLADLKKIGTLKAVFPLAGSQPLEGRQIQRFLGKSYDSDYSWSDDKMYCSELVGKLIGVAPTPMVFDPHFWPPQFQRLDGQPGISPDGVYRKLVELTTQGTTPTP